MEYLRKVKSGEVKFSRSFEGLFLSVLRVFLLSFPYVEIILCCTLLTLGSSFTGELVHNLDLGSVQSWYERCSNTTSGRCL